MRKGSKMTDEQKRKLGEARKGQGKGRVFSEEHKTKLSKSLKGHIPWNKGKKMSKDFCEKNSKSHKGQISPNKGKRMSEETKRKISEAHKGKKASDKTRKKLSELKKGKPSHKKGKPGKKHTAESKEKMREIAIKRSSCFKDTSIELKIEKELNRHGLILNSDFYKQVPLCKVARVDFYLPATRTVIQADGCYWHNCPTCKHKERIDATERDRKQDAVLTFNGFNVYRFWEHEINEDVSKCVDKINL
jgi:very-short-patch-repair endonuclease